jgi:signal transduction histidine kinase
MKKKQIEKDPRVKRRKDSWKGYILTYVILLTLAAGQFMIYAEYMSFQTMPPEYIFGMLGYWAIVTAVLILCVSNERRRTFEKPMRKLGEAAKEVAEGDFSVYLSPIHRSDQYDFVDVMFEDFNKMVEALGSIETMKNDFIGNVSHEIKTPLAVIQSYATALQQNDLPDNQRNEYVSTIITASKKLNDLVTNILKLNKLENQGIAATTESFDLCRQLADCAITFENLWEEKNIAFVADIEDRALIYADKSMLEIVWQNLLSNAVKFTDAGGKITLTQTSDHDSITVTISDTGCGMDDTTKNRIFDKFYQGDTSHSGEGNGLGLALALSVIEFQCGSITVNSKIGKGTTFTVILPVR